MCSLIKPRDWSFFVFWNDLLSASNRKKTQIIGEFYFLPIIIVIPFCYCNCNFNCNWLFSNYWKGERKLIFCSFLRISVLLLYEFDGSDIEKKELNAICGTISWTRGTKTFRETRITFLRRLGRYLPYFMIRKQMYFMLQWKTLCRIQAVKIRILQYEKGCFVNDTYQRDAAWVCFP